MVGLQASQGLPAVEAERQGHEPTEETGSRHWEERRPGEEQRRESSWAGQGRRTEEWQSVAELAARVARGWGKVTAGSGTPLSPFSSSRHRDEQWASPGDTAGGDAARDSRRAKVKRSLLLQVVQAQMPVTLMPMTLKTTECVGLFFQQACLCSQAAWVTLQHC